jgi:hypothetical protein
MFVVYRNEVRQLLRIKHVVVVIALLSIVMGGFSFSSQSRSQVDQVENDSNKSGEASAINTILGTKTETDSFSLSQSSQTGLLVPTQIEQSGFMTTEASKARTDTGENAASNISIDESNGWFVNSTKVEVWGLQQLYGVNGTFDDGVAPWTNYTINGGSNTQIPSYNSTGQYIVCRNIGNYKSNPGLGPSYTHSVGTEIGWEQVINNTPSSLTFELEFDFLYATGPLDPNGDDATSLAGHAGVFWQLGTDGWYYPMETLSSRNTWYTITHEFTIPSPSSQLQLYVGLYIATANMQVYVNRDYDDDPLGLPDGVANAQNITVYIDNVQFTSLTPPSPGSVGLTFNAGAYSVPITGSTYGTATLSNPNLWSVDPLQVEITSNTSVIFSYSVTSLFQRYINSSWTTDPTKQGVGFDIHSGTSSSLDFFTYISKPANLENYTVDILFPSDWENITVWDPLRTDVTGLCGLSTGRIHVPTTEVSRSGWWEVNLEAKNYIQTVSAQQLQTDGITWSQNTVFWAGNTTRAQVELGTLDNTPEQGSPVSITWLLPDGTEWAYDSVTSMTNGIVNSSIWNLGGLNTTAGQWEIEAIWQNGTEVGYGVVFFDLYHIASATVKYPAIDSEYGQVISNQITYVDANNGNYLLDDSVSIAANWSETVVTFAPNFAKKWWEADFDTTDIGGGQFTVVVNLTRPYFKDITCQFTVVSTYAAAMTLPSIGTLPEESGLNEIYSIDIHYALANGTGIEGATISFSYTGPSSGLTEGTHSDLELGNYTLGIVGVLSGQYQVTVGISKPFHEAGFKSFTLIIGETGTSFISLNGTASLVGYGLDYRLVVSYANSTGDGLSGATVNIVSATPSSGLTIGSVGDLGDGLYSVTFTPTVSQSYSVVLRANLTNHETQYITFTLLVTSVQTSLTASTSGATISVDQTYVLQVTYEDEASNPILGATVTIVTVPSGLSYSVLEIGGGVYNITLTPSVTEAKSFQLSFRATKVNYQTSSVAFSLFVQLIPTDLDILMGSTLASISVIEEYDMVLSYFRTDTNVNITSAHININMSPATGITSIVDVIGETYQIRFLPQSVGIWQVTISANRTYFVTSIIQIEIDVSSITTTLSCVNGTADLVPFGSSYRLLLRYTNSTGDGILGAAVHVDEVAPSTGLLIGNTTSEGYGYYSILLTPSLPDAYSLTLRANYTNHATRYISFSLVVSQVETVLIPHTSGATISLDKNYTVQLEFKDEFDNPISGATISITNPPSGLSFSVLEIGNGEYNVTLTPSVTRATSFQLSFRASKTIYQSSVTAFVLQVQEIPTDIVILAGDTTKTIPYAENYQVDIVFVRTDTGENVTLADVTPVATPATGLDWHVEEIGDIYRITFVPERVGSWQITLSANRTSYVRQSILLELEVEQIGTTLNDISLVESLTYGRAYNFTFNYLMSNGSRVLGADISGSGTGSSWIIPSQSLTGSYTVMLTPESVGSFEVSLEFSRTGFTSQTTTLSFAVVTVKVSVVDIQGLTGLEGQPTSLTLRLVESDTGNPVSGATVVYQIVTAGIPGTSEALEESEAGTYSKNFVMPNSDTNSQIRIFVYLDNYEMSGELEYMEQPLTPTVSEVTLITRTVTQWSPLIIFGLAVSAGYAERRHLLKKQRRRNLEALAVKKRFDDVRNIVGVVVLHRVSGIPVYSRMLREGFDDSLISAFITAISQFRAEFDVDQKEWVITPISDIIMAVRTQNLVCAFITMGPPTSTQEERMIQFAKSVGFVFDSKFEEAPVLTIDAVTEDRFDELFDELLDMNLHQKHRIVDTKGLPKRPKCLNNTIAELKSSEGFELEDMADRMAACGIEEAKAYKIILDAIHNGQLVPIGGDDSIRGSRTLDAAPEKDMDTVIAEDAPEESMHEGDKTERDKFVDDIESLLKAEKDGHEDTVDDHPD